MAVLPIILKAFDNGSGLEVFMTIKKELFNKEKD